MKLTLLLLLLISSSANAGFNPEDYQPKKYEVSSINPSKALWDSYGFTEYSFLIKQTACWCFSALTRVYVIDGEVVHTEVIENTPDQPVPGEFKTIDGYLKQISDYHNKSPSTFQVKYARGLGFPKEFYVDPLADSLDDEDGFIIYEVVPLERKTHNNAKHGDR